MMFSFKSQSIKSAVSIVLSLFLLLLSWVVVQAATPSTGTVVEGVSAPDDVEIGSTRAEVEAIYGAPSYCQTWGGEPGNRGWCAFHAAEPGQASFIYDNATNSPNDKVKQISWTFREWETTAGVSLSDFEANSQIAVDAYPNADVTYTNTFGNEGVVVRDEALGIEFRLSFSFHGDPAVTAQIFEPTTVPTAVTLSASGVEMTVPSLLWVVVSLLAGVTVGVGLLHSKR